MYRADSVMNLHDSGSSMYTLSKSVADASGLGQGLTHDLSFDRPLNTALRSSLLSTPPVQGGIAALRVHTEVINSYIRVASVIFEIIVNRARITPQLKSVLMKDIFKASTDSWQYPLPSQVNKLGA